MTNVRYAWFGFGFALFGSACTAAATRSPAEAERADAAVRRDDAVETARSDGRVCAGLRLSTAADVAAARDCERVHGDLRVDPLEPGAVRDVELPQLRQITGSLLVVLANGLERIALPALTSVGSEGEGSVLEIGFDAGSLQRIALPALREVHGGFGVAALSGLRALDVSALAQVDGVVLLESLPSLVELSLDPELDAGEQLIASGLCSLDADGLLELTASAEPQSSLRSIGCCTASRFGCQYSACACAPDAR